MIASHRIIGAILLYASLFHVGCFESTFTPSDATHERGTPISRPAR